MLLIALSFIIARICDNDKKSIILYRSISIWYIQGLAKKEIEREYKMKKRTLAVFIISLLILGAFMLGVKVGEKRVIDNQIITNENDEQGFYYSDYSGHEYSYYYE